MTTPENKPGNEAKEPVSEKQAEAENASKSGEDKANEGSEAEPKAGSAQAAEPDPKEESQNSSDKPTVATAEMPSENVSASVEKNDAVHEKDSREKSGSEKSNGAGSGSAKTDSETPSDEANKSAVNLTLTQHHVSHLLADVLQDEDSSETTLKGLRFPMIFDLLLASGLLVAVGGFTVGLFHMYLVHSASQSISEERYKAAIHILKGAPLPQVFARPGSDTEELLSKARYLDAMKQLEAGTEINDALKELSEIQPGSKYFTLAQEAINENTEPAPMMLQGGAETTETNPSKEEPKQSLIEKTLKEDE